MIECLDAYCEMGQFPTEESVEMNKSRDSVSYLVLPEWSVRKNSGNIVVVNFKFNESEVDPFEAKPTRTLSKIPASISAKWKAFLEYYNHIITYSTLNDDAKYVCILSWLRSLFCIAFRLSKLAPDCDLLPPYFLLSVIRLCTYICA